MSPTLTSTLIGLTLLSVIFFVIERILGKGSLPLMRKGWWTDVSYFFFTPLIGKAFSKLALLLPAGLLILCGVATAEELRARVYSGFGPISAQPLWLQAIAIYLLADFLGYWSHRLFHGGRWWPFHAVHHSSEELDWLSSIRVHPVNDVVSKLIQVTPLMFLGFNPWVTLSTAPVFTFYAIFLHARIDWDFGPFRYVVATPMFHRWHHSRQPEAWDKNFAGLFPLWDLLFGTFYMPKGRVPEDFGITGSMPNHLPGQLWEPIRSLWVGKDER